MVESHVKAGLELHKGLASGRRPPFRGEDIEAALASAAQSYIDVFYPPIGLSVGVEEVNSKYISWKRPTEFIDFDARPSKGGVRESKRWQAESRLVEVFDEGIQANDILQGQLGNCWFMCALAALCEFPLLVDRLFVQKWSKDETSSEARASPHGFYELRFCTSGVWRTIRVDDYFPCKATKEGYTPIFSRCKGAELWVLLVEKAYAKLQGSYYNCRLGDPGDGLLDLTGAPCVGFQMVEPALTFEDFWTWDRNDCIVCASTPGTDTFTEGGGGRGGGATGLVPGHAYTVLQARSIRKGRFQGAQVMQLRNPWGEFEWKGKWSDTSAEFAACRAELEDDGIDSNESGASMGSQHLRPLHCPC